MDWLRDNPSARAFVATLGVLGMLTLAWMATGRPFPGQGLPVQAVEVAEYQAELSALGLLADDPLVINPRLWIPTDPGWDGIGFTMSTLDQRYRVAVWMARGEVAWAKEAVTGSDDRWTFITTGFGDALATSWSIDGYRHMGFALWSSGLTNEDAVAAGNLVDRLQALR